MNKVLSACALTVLLVACNSKSPTTTSTDTSPVLAEAFGGKVTALQVERELRNMDAEQRRRLMAAPEEFKKLIGVMLFQQRAVEVAEETGLIDAEYEYVLQRDRQRRIARRMASDAYEQAEIPSLEAEALKYYEENPQLFTPTPRLNIAHIQLNAPTPEEKERRMPEAQMILEKLAEGVEFGRLASDYSEDFGRFSAGEIGYIKQGDMVEEFWVAASALEEGEVSGVVETRPGLNIIKLLDRGPVHKTSFEDAKEAIMERLEEQHRKKYVEEWVKSIAPPDDVNIQQDALDQWWTGRFDAVRAKGEREAG